MVHYKAAANEWKHPLGIYQVALAYHHGDCPGMAKDVERAKNYFKRAIKAWHKVIDPPKKPASSAVAERQSRYQNTARNLARATAASAATTHTPKEKHPNTFWLHTTAKKAEALYYLGLCHDAGHGTVQSRRQATEYYKRAADLGHGNAMFSLGMCYITGDGDGTGSPNYELAMETFQRAWEQCGHVHALFNLGVCYENGVLHGDTEPTAQQTFDDCRRAVEIYRVAIKFGHVPALVNLAVCYSHGEGVAMDHNKALKLFREAAAHNSPDGLYYLGVCYETGRGIQERSGLSNLEKAFECYSMAAEMGHPRALYNQGVFYENGHCHSEQPQEERSAKAFECYMKAAKKGHAGAMNNLAVCYRNGRGTRRDQAKSEQYFLKAAELGHQDAVVFASVLRRS